ncbi:MAG: FGGY family carbohydrate kinase, partial [Actinomycetota bacterium]|nr:FGGY family carbohydrate kinase [Actinomycetota bacterium]
QVKDHLSDVAAISVVGQQHGLVCLDADGAPLRPAKLWNDTTSASQARALVERLGAAAWSRRCGLVPVSSITITKLAWLMENEPHVVANAHAFMLPHDFLTFRLTGERVTDRGDASGTGWWSPISEMYEPELLGLVVPDPQGLIDRLPTVLGPQDQAGVVTPEAAALTGLAAGTPVACGTGDNMGSAYALGLEPGDLAMSLGTSGTVYAVSEDAVSDAAGIVAGFADATGRYLPLVATLNATRVTDTVALWLGVGRAEFADLALQARPDPGLVLKPYFDGERTPDLPDASGTFFGLDNTTTRSDIAAAVHVGIVCGLMSGIDALAAAQVRTGGQLHLTGGGARSAAFRQWVADIWGRPVAVHVENESAAAGACRQAVTVATGTEASWRLTPDLVVDPRADTDGALYREAYERTGP